MRFYPRLAWSGLQKNRKLYMPYLFACIGMTAMLYIIAYLASSPSLYTVPMGMRTIQLVLGLGQWVVAVFAVLFLYYTNAFLLRRRKREFGLYHVLGMGKVALGRILFWETLMVGVFSLMSGLTLGALGAGCAEFVLFRLIGISSGFHLEINGDAALFCTEVIAVVFLLLFFNALWQLRRDVSVELLKSESVGEKPPRSNWFLVIPGLALLGGAYYLAVSIQDPVTAMLLFFVAVIMVILGTYLLFIAGSVTLCRTLQKNERFYYQKRHFVSLASLVYRMKRNGAGLASICILSTMVLVMIGSTASLYFGAEDAIRAVTKEFSYSAAEYAAYRSEFYSMYGSLFFLGILLSLIFVFAAALMLYYKQVAEGYEDAARFAIMQKVGMTKRDIRESINAQMLLVFFLPLLGAVVHLCFAQPMILKMLQLFGIDNTALVLGVTGASVAIFAVFYCAMYYLTSNAYFSIVSGAEQRVK